MRRSKRNLDNEDTGPRKRQIRRTTVALVDLISCAAVTAVLFVYSTSTIVVDPCVSTTLGGVIGWISIENYFSEKLDFLSVLDFRRS